MENMGFYGYHGVLEEERKLGQKFFVDAVLYLPLKEAGRKDDLNFTANYAAVYEVIRRIVTKERFALLEGLAERICQEIFASCPSVQKILLRIKKPEAPIDGMFDYFGVEIERERV
jgi:dihydroneopterin aldolase